MHCFASKSLLQTGAKIGILAKNLHTLNYAKLFLVWIKKRAHL